ncbi:MAG: FoF1 ATP synthase subunit a [Bacillota bacterium]
MEHIASEIYPERYDLFGLSISESSIICTCVVFALLILLLAFRFIVFPKFTTVPKGFQVFVEWFVTAFDNMAKGTVGNKMSVFLGPYIFSVVIFIAVNVLVELFRIRSPLADINTCLALALMTFILIHFFGLKKHGPVGRVKYYFNPVAIAAPIRFMDECLTPVSMTFRLFGSILSGMLIMEVVYSFVPLVLPAFLSVMFTIFHAVIQSYIFGTLTLTFIAEVSE